MKAKQANRYFLTTNILQILFVAILVVFPSWTISFMSDTIITEVLFLIPAFFYIKLSHCKLNEVFGFHKIKISSVLMIILFLFLTNPMAEAVNAFSLLFVDNTVLEAADAILEMPMWYSVFSIALFSPLCEEIAMRGVVFRSYRNSGSLWQSVILSALLFGLMHMNLNQATYAFVVGIFMALLVEATGSLWSSVIYHALFNLSSVIPMYMYSPTVSDGAKTASTIGRDQLMLFCGQSFLIGLALLIPAACILVWLFRNEGRADRIPYLLGHDVRGNIVTVSFVVSMIICLMMMVALDISSKWMPYIQTYLE